MLKKQGEFQHGPPTERSQREARGSAVISRGHDLAANCGKRWIMSVSSHSIISSNHGRWIDSQLFVSGSLPSVVSPPVCPQEK